MTALARDTGLAMFVTQDTAPLASVLPSTIMASSSTSPSTFSVAPCPEGNGLKIFCNVFVQKENIARFCMFWLLLLQLSTLPQ